MRCLRYTTQHATLLSLRGGAVRLILFAAVGTRSDTDQASTHPFLPRTLSPSLFRPPLSRPLLLGRRVPHMTRTAATRHDGQKNPDHNPTTTPDACPRGDLRPLPRSPRPGGDVRELRLRSPGHRPLQEDRHGLGQGDWLIWLVIGRRLFFWVSSFSACGCVLASSWDASQVVELACLGRERRSCSVVYRVIRLGWAEQEIFFVPSTNMPP